jgi:hypothetical protein
MNDGIILAHSSSSNKSMIKINKCKLQFYK